MGKVCSCLSIALLFAAAAMVPWKPSIAHAQTGVASTCNSQPVTVPMPGHYTGPWHSEADYHFKVHFDQYGPAPPSDWDLEMKIIIEGKLDVSVGSNGTLTGSATGTVDAPIYHNGVHDISSGIGTISGQLGGAFIASGGTLVLSHPVIVMQWGTFGGRAVSTSPVMPDYQFPIGAMDCISTQGTITESGFPTMNITNDSTGQLTQAPGNGVATGTWQLTSDASSQFSALSQKVTDFVSQANAFLNGPSGAASAALWNQTVIQPLKDLESQIQQQPDIAKCLLDRLRSWEASALSNIETQIKRLGTSQAIADLRQAGALLPIGSFLASDCGDSTVTIDQTLFSHERLLLDASIAKGAWSEAVLFIREIELLRGNSVRHSLQSEVDQDFHRLLTSAPAGASTLDVARMAYALGDQTDAAAFVKVGTSVSLFSDGLPPGVTVVKTKKHKTPRHGHKAVKSKPKAKPKVAPKSLANVLMSGTTPMRATSGGSPPSFSWNTMASATRYVVVVTAASDQTVLWSWSGTAASVRFGDTTIDGVADSTRTDWPIPLATGGYSWSVLALDGQGKIVGLRPGVKGS